MCTGNLDLKSEVIAKTFGMEANVWCEERKASKRTLVTTRASESQVSLKSGGKEFHGGSGL